MSQQTSETERLEDPGGPQVMHAEPAATYGIHPPTHAPHPHARGWPLGAKLTVAVLGVVLVAVLAISMITISHVNTKANKAQLGVTQLSQALGVSASQVSQDNSATGGAVSRLGGSVTSLSGQIARIETQLGALSRTVSHSGMCLRVMTDNTGNVTSVTESTPVLLGRNVTCPAGVLVLAAPTHG